MVLGANPYKRTRTAVVDGLGQVPGEKIVLARTEGRPRPGRWGRLS